MGHTTEVFMVLVATLAYMEVGCKIYTDSWCEVYRRRKNKIKHV